MFSDWGHSPLGVGRGELSGGPRKKEISMTRDCKALISSVQGFTTFFMTMDIMWSKIQNSHELLR